MGFLADFGRSNAYQIGQHTIKDWSDTNRAATLAVPQAQVEAANAEGARIAKSIEMARQMEADKIARAKAEREQKMWYRENEAPIHADLGIAALGVYGRMPSVSEHAKSLLPMYTEEVNGVRVFRGTKSLENWKKAVGDSKDFFALEQRDLLTKQAEIGKTMAAAMDEVRAAERAVQGLQPRVEPGYVEEGMGGSTVTVPPDPALVTKAQAAVAAARQKYEAEKDKMNRLNAALEDNARAAGEKMQVLSQGAIGIMPGSGRAVENPMEFAPGSSGGKGSVRFEEVPVSGNMLQKVEIKYGSDGTTEISRTNVGAPYPRWNPDTGVREDQRGERSDKIRKMNLQRDARNDKVIDEAGNLVQRAAQLEAAIAEGRRTGNYAGADQVIGYYVNKALDPNSVVMPSEFARLTETQSVASKFMAQARKQGGAEGIAITPEVRSALVGIIKKVKPAIVERAQARLKWYKDDAEALGFDADETFKGVTDYLMGYVEGPQKNGAPVKFDPFKKGGK